mgnify:CR=1 FL=1
MLALSRRIGESIMIGNDVEITIIEVKGEERPIDTLRRSIEDRINKVYKEEREHEEELETQPMLTLIRGKIKYILRNKTTHQQYAIIITICPRRLDIQHRSQNSKSNIK